MSLGPVVVERANLTDVDGILKLAEANEEEHGGTLSGHLEREAVIETLGRIPSVVARKNGQVLGFLLTWEKASSHISLVGKMLEAYPGQADDYVYGPVCVDSSMRGRSLAQTMFAELRRLLPGREGILFIRADNEPSLRAHFKMGMHPVADFNHEGFKFIVFSYPG